MVGQQIFLFYKVTISLEINETTYFILSGRDSRKISMVVGRLKGFNFVVL